MRDQSIRKVAEALIARQAAHTQYELESMFSHCCDSPIEQRLLLSLLSVGTLHVGNAEIEAPQRRIVVIQTDAVTRRFEPFPAPDLSEGFCRIECQKSVGRYRSDFCVSWVFGSFEYTVHVEADGHDFHERTKEQARHDKARDRFYTTQGLKVLRFTGSEIHRNANQCAMEVFTLLSDLHEQDAMAGLEKP